MWIPTSLIVIFVLYMLITSFLGENPVDKLEEKLNRLDELEAKEAERDNEEEDYDPADDDYDDDDRERKA